MKTLLVFLIFLFPITRSEYAKYKSWCETKIYKTIDVNLAVEIDPVSGVFIDSIGKWAATSPMRIRVIKQYEKVVFEPNEKSISFSMQVYQARRIPSKKDFRENWESIKKSYGLDRSGER